MLSIMWRDSSSDGTVMKLEGQVIGPWVAELRTYCELLLGEGSSLSLDMGGVSYLDPEGIALVRQLMTQGVRLDGCSPFLVELLKTEPSSA